MPFNYNFQTDDELISQKWNQAKIGNSNFPSNPAKPSLVTEKPAKSQIIIRRAKSADAERIIEINKKSWLATYPNPEFDITVEDMLTINWQKALEKSQRNIENEANFWLLEIENYSGNEIDEVEQNSDLIGKKTDLVQKENNQTQNSEGKNFNENQNSAVNLTKKKVVGFVRFFVNEDDRSEIKAIYLDPEFTNLGLGTILLTFALERLGFEHNFEVRAASYNQRAIEFYQKFGFKVSDKKIENFQLQNGKSLPQVQLLVNKDKLQKKLVEIKDKTFGRFYQQNWQILVETSQGSNFESSDNPAKPVQQFNQALGTEKTHDNSQNDTFTILMPPPNLTGNLHAGHALEHYIMDSLSRFERQNGKQVLYYPGIDHAGIQLEGVINKLINKGEFDEVIKTKLELNPNQNSNEIAKTNANLAFDELEKNQQTTFTKTVTDFAQFQAQKVEDRANWLKKNSPETWLECAWSKVTLWRDNQKNQSMILGDSPDWDKQLFTLDERAVDMVNLAFETYWRDGLIYRDSYLINWSVALQTALSDVPEDIGRVEKIDPFVTFIYKASQIKASSVDSKILDLVAKINQNVDSLQFLVATVRIETVFADVAVAMHPDKLAETFHSLNQSEIELLRECLNNQLITILLEIEPLGVQNIRLIIDETVDLAFGTGLLKITPAHDLADYNIAKKHGFVSFSQAIGRDGKLTEICGEYAGLIVEKARPLILKKLLETGFIPSKKTVNQI